MDWETVARWEWMLLLLLILALGVFEMVRIRREIRRDRERDAGR